MYSLGPRTHPSRFHRRTDRDRLLLQPRLASVDTLRDNLRAQDGMASNFDAVLHEPGRARTAWTRWRR